ncbi:unnamed protein product [Taenia asiatica]|uniref:Serine/arginine-rich splicing factor SR45a n=1 Tax=Taenia asiatica TaxID=60517 RepID=A0A0R3W8X9_TAEAS|nr:unnamed protein product [Taenia asiatica]
MIRELLFFESMVNYLSMHCIKGRYHEESSRDFGRHGERSSRRRISRERRRDRSRDRSRERDHSLVPSVSTSSGVPGGVTTGSVAESGASRSTRSGESRRRSERESHRSHHRHRRTSRHRSPSCQTSRPEPTESLNSQLSAIPSQSIDPLEAASAAAADINEKIRRASASDGVSDIMSLVLQVWYRPGTSLKTEKDIILGQDMYCQRGIGSDSDDDVDLKRSFCKCGVAGV